MRTAVVLFGGSLVIACGVLAGSSDTDVAPTPAVDAAVEDADAGPSCPDRCVERLAIGLPPIAELTVDDAFVYFSARSLDQQIGWSLSKLPKTGGAVVPLVPAPQLREPTAGLAVDDSFVYVTAYTAGAGAGLRRVPKDGGPAETIDGCNTAFGAALGPTDVFWITAACGGQVRLRRAAKDTPSSSSEVLIEVPNQYSYAEFGYAALDDTNVYWASASQLRKIERTFAGDASTLIADVSSGDAGLFRAIAVDDRVYARLGHEIIAVDKAGGIPTPLVTDLGGTRGRAGLVAMGDRLYFTAPEKGIVGSILKAGGQVDVIASDQAAPVGIAVDATHVYWSNMSDGTIWRARR